MNKPRHIFTIVFGFTLCGVLITGCQQSPKPTERPEEISQARGQQVYSENCASCHGVSGAGASMLLEGKNVHFNEAEWQAKYTDEQLLTIIKTGRGSMPSFDGLFTPEEEKSLVAYIRTLASQSQTN